MEEQIISFETAKLASEKLQNWDQFAPYLWYDEYGKLNKGNFYPFCYYTASTQSLLQKWIRDKYDIHINIQKMYECHKLPAVFEGWIIYIAGPTWETRYECNNKYQTKFFASYEDALENGLYEALKVIDEKK